MLPRHNEPKHKNLKNRVREVQGAPSFQETISPSGEVSGDEGPFLGVSSTRILVDCGQGWDPHVYGNSQV